jgi:putative nucleotidyltransferase with HDIG domain
MDLSQENIANMLDEIPTFSQSVIRIIELTSDIDSSNKELVAQITHDPILTAKVLKLVNSAYFGLARSVDSIQHSVVYVGINTIKNLALSVAAMGSLPQTNKAGLEMKEFWLHSLKTAVVAKLLAQKNGIPKSAVSAYFISGLLHDIGKIILSQAVPEAYKAVLAEATDLKKTLHQLEQEAFGIDHAALGAMLAEKWQLPANIVDAIRHHHHAQHTDEQILNRTIYVASEVAKLIDQEDNQDVIATEISPAVQAWLGMELAQVVQSLPNLQTEIDNAKIFIQLS